MIQLLRFLDIVSGTLLCFAVVFGPWAFGTTQTWSEEVMNTLGFTLGILLLLKFLVRRFIPSPDRGVTAHSPTARWLAMFSLLALLYSLVSALNARATYAPLHWQFEYRPAIAWLPHSYDSVRTWNIFWQNLGLFGLFWALRDWILTSERDEQVWNDKDSSAGNIRLPSRLRFLLGVLAVSGSLLALEGLIQRFQGGDKLLWLKKPSINGGTIIEFASFPYRANASQYFNLLWPLILGFWTTSLKAAPSRNPEPKVRASRWSHLLLLGAIVMAICPLVATSRAGAAVLLVNLGLAALILLPAKTMNWKLKTLIPVTMGIILTFGGLLGWAALGPRLKTLSVDAAGQGGRFELSRVGWEMAMDNPVFGTGPGTLEPMYQLYRHHWNDFWPAQLHNDWVETLATYGAVGFGLVLLCLALAGWQWVSPGGIHASVPFVRFLWIALAGCLAHAAFDWPMECHSVLTLFLVICAILSCLSRRRTEY